MRGARWRCRRSSVPVGGVVVIPAAKKGASGRTIFNELSARKDPWLSIFCNRKALRKSVTRQKSDALLSGYGRGVVAERKTYRSASGTS